MTETLPTTPDKSALLTQLLRSLCHLIAVAAISFWAFVSWPLPFPGLLTGIAAIALTVVIWALFLSPRPVLRTDRFGQALIELLLLGGATGALLSLGVHWLVAILFFVSAAALGFFAGRRA